MIIIGLGNIGKEYINTRHNVGFMYLDFLSAKNNFNFTNYKNLKCELAKVGEIVYVKPTTFMNKSGECVKAVLDYYKESISNLIIVHDDIDLSVGKVKKVTTGGSGGHNGIISIINYLGTKDFNRTKIGVAPDFYNPQIHKAEDFVLKKFSAQELIVLEELFSQIDLDPLKS